MSWPVKHGDSGSPEYEVWRSMKQRCYNENHKNYRRYGGRGITMDPRWRRSYTSFLQDMGRRPGSGFDIDRKDNDGHYTKANCRWLRHQKNCENRLNAHGEDSVSAKLTNQEVVVLKALVNFGVPQHKVATMMGVSQPQVSRIYNERSRT